MSSKGNKLEFDLCNIPHSSLQLSNLKMLLIEIDCIGMCHLDHVEFSIFFFAVTHLFSPFYLLYGRKGTNFSI